MVIQARRSRKSLLQYETSEDYESSSPKLSAKVEAILKEKAKAARKRLSAIQEQHKDHLSRNSSAGASTRNPNGITPTYTPGRKRIVSHPQPSDSPSESPSCQTEASDSKSSPQQQIPEDENSTLSARFPSGQDPGNADAVPSWKGSRKMTFSEEVDLHEVEKEAEEEESSECSEESGKKKTRTWLESQRAFWHDSDSSSAAWWTHTFIICLISLSVLIFLLQTLPDIDPERLEEGPRKEFFSNFWYYSEVVCVLVFTVEYVMRFVTATEKWPFFKNFMNMIDLMSVLPFYLQIMLQFMTISGDNLTLIKLLRVLRLFRVFRIVKLSKYSTSLLIVMTTLQRSVTALLTLLCIAGLSTVLFSAAIYSAEGVGFPEHSFCYQEGSLQLVPESDDNYQYCSGFNSIPAAMWWCLITMSTVGYGDVYPRTDLGKLVGIICALCGILSLALPITVVGSNFTDVYDEYTKARLEKERKEREERKESKIRRSSISITREGANVGLGHSATTTSIKTLVNSLTKVKTGVSSVGKAESSPTNRIGSHTSLQRPQLSQQSQEPTQQQLQQLQGLAPGSPGALHRTAPHLSSSTSLPATTQDPASALASLQQRAARHSSSSKELVSHSLDTTAAPRHSLDRRRAEEEGKHHHHHHHHHHLDREISLSSNNLIISPPASGVSSSSKLIVPPPQQLPPRSVAATTATATPHTDSANLAYAETVSKIRELVSLANKQGAQMTAICMDGDGQAFVCR